MPRIRESKEAQVLRYFREAPLEAAKVVYGLVQSAMKERTPKERKPAKRRKEEPQAA